MDIGYAIKVFRVRRGLNQHELATFTGLNGSYISLLERGKRDPALSTVMALANALRVPLLVLVFVASNDDDKLTLTQEVREKLSYAAMNI